jgi:hypothetical protein
MRRFLSASSKFVAIYSLNQNEERAPVVKHFSLEFLAAG